MSEKVLSYLKEVATLTEKKLDELLYANDTYPESIHQVMRYSTFAGGKRIRPALIMASWEACGGQFGYDTVLMTCSAIEMFHTFSLMHDDLPCMDDDDYRRGKPTAHRAFSEAIAVLGGDALCIYAYEILARVGRIDIIHELSTALGTHGMIGGQVVDIESEGRPVTREIVDYIHKNKTSALITAAVRIGALLAGADDTRLNALTTYGENIGLAFQVVDDILDEEGTTEQLGKDAGSDRLREKATYPAVIGLDASREAARSLIDQSWQIIDFFGDDGMLLKELAGFIRTRIH